MNPEERWVTTGKEYGLYLYLEPCLRIAQACAKANEHETGGILIGYYADSETTAMITQVTVPTADSKRGRHWFQRGVLGLEDLLRRCWRNPQRTYYLGEWHYHPAYVVEPSQTDFTQMKAISQSANFQCEEPIMLIAGKSQSEKINMRAWVCPRNKEALEYNHADRRQGTTQPTE